MCFQADNCTEDVNDALQISHRAPADMYIKTTLILSGLVASFYATFFCFSSFWVSLDAHDFPLVRHAFLYNSLIYTAEPLRPSKRIDLQASADLAGFCFQFCISWGLHGRNRRQHSARCKPWGILSQHNAGVPPGHHLGCRWCFLLHVEAAACCWASYIHQRRWS